MTIKILVEQDFAVFTSCTGEEHFMYIYNNKIKSKPKNLLVNITIFFEKINLLIDYLKQKKKNSK